MLGNMNLFLDRVSFWTVFSLPTRSLADPVLNPGVGVVADGSPGAWWVLSPQADATAGLLLLDAQSLLQVWTEGPSRTQERGIKVKCGVGRPCGQ